jgi:2-polyprenyl-6-methoxyphenol hydroxylase-like FAD-dependent oxidoreductase
MKPILISGAGLAGLLLSRSLRRHGIPFELYERDAHVSVRGQGYRIRLSSDGLTALEAVLTASEMEELRAGTSQTGSGGMHSLDGLTGEPTPWAKPGGNRKPYGGPKLGGDVVGIARGFLRAELIKGLDDKIHWNRHITGYEHSRDQNGGVFAIFADGTKSPEGSMLVGADGIHSGITKQLTGGKVRAYDTGARMIHGQSPSTAFAELGDGVWSVSDPTSIPNTTLGLITNVRPRSLDDPKLELGWVFIGSPGSFDAPNGNFSVMGKVAADLSRGLTSKWHPKIRSIFESQNDAEAAFLKMYTSAPEGVPEWENDARVTIVGDAVHAMTPAGGVGANTALRDAAFLGRLIADAQGWTEGITSEYEREMRVYASEHVKMSFEEASGRFNTYSIKREKTRS